LSIGIERSCGIGAQTAPSIGRQINASIERVASLERESIDGMFAVYRTYYDATSETAFAADLKEKDFVVLLRDEDDAIAGFSTLAVIDTATDQGRLRAIYSGDTIIDRAHWGTQALAFTWLRFSGEVKAQAPGCPLYWFLIVKGHRTYRYLSAFSIDFYPNWLAPTPAWATTIMTTLARRPDVAFFLQRNPGYTYGEELVCLTELASANLRPLARRVFDRGLCL
jgi:hypothetical protein